MHDTDDPIGRVVSREDGRLIVEVFPIQTERFRISSMKATLVEGEGAGEVRTEEHDGKEYVYSSGDGSNPYITEMLR